MKTSKQSTTEIVKNIKNSSLVLQQSIRAAVEKAVTSIVNDIQKLMKEANYYKGEIVKLSNQWKEIKKEVEILEGRRQELREKEQKINEKAKAVEKQEEELVELHKVLYNRGKVLKEKEEKLLQKAAQISGKARSIEGIKKDLGKL